MNHFDKIDDLNEICQAIDISEEYLRELQTAFIHNDADMKRTVLKMILDSTISADVIKVILEFVHMDCLTDIISELLNSDLHTNNVPLLVQRIENCLEDNEYEKTWCKPLELFLKDEHVDAQVKIKIKNIISILEQSGEDIYKTIELWHETRLILREWLHVESLITLFDISTEATRRKLFKELLKQVGSITQIEDLNKLLTLWPEFANSDTWQNDPRMMLLEASLSLNTINGKDEMRIIGKLLNERNPPKELLRSFFEHVRKSAANKILLIRFCVLSKDDFLIRSVRDHIVELREIGGMPQSLDLYLRKLGL